jgi:hypothetical protein
MYMRYLTWNIYHCYTGRGNTSHEPPTYNGYARKLSSPSKTGILFEHTGYYIRSLMTALTLPSASASLLSTTIAAFKSIVVTVYTSHLILYRTRADTTEV